MQERDIVRYHYYSIEAPITAIISPHNTYCIIWTNELNLFFLKSL